MLVAVVCLIVGVVTVRAQGIRVDESTYDCFKIREAPGKQRVNIYCDTIVCEEQVRLFVLCNESEEDYVVFLTIPMLVNKPLDKRISLFFVAPGPGSNVMPLYEVILYTRQYSDLKKCYQYSDNSLYPWRSLKILKPGETYRIVCISNSSSSKTDFKECITYCSRNYFWKTAKNFFDRESELDEYSYGSDMIVVVL